MKPAFFWLGFRGPDCNVIAEQGGGPDARPSWAGSGPRAGCFPHMYYWMLPSHGCHTALAGHSQNTYDYKTDNVEGLVIARYW